MTTLQLRASDGATLSLPGSTITSGVAGKTVVSAADVAGYERPALQHADGSRLRDEPRRGL